MKKILVPTDFSEQATYALDLAVQIAKKNNGEVHVLHVLELPDGHSLNFTGEVAAGDPMTGVFVAQLVNKAKKSLGAINKKYANDNVHTHLEGGHTFRSISNSISKKKIDLVVMGTKGSSGVDELLIGSNAEKVVRNADCPVIAIKAKTNADKIKNIVFATDLGGKQEKLVKKVKAMQEAFGAKLHILRVNTPGNFENERAIKRRMEEFTKENKLSNVTHNIYSDVLEDDGIMYFAESIKADMIAIGTHGRHGFMHILAGSIAEDLVNHAKRPVWTCKIG